MHGWQWHLDKRGKPQKPVTTPMLPESTAALRAVHSINTERKIWTDWLSQELLPATRKGDDTYRYSMAREIPKSARISEYARTSLSPLCPAFCTGDLIYKLFPHLPLLCINNACVSNFHNIFLLSQDSRQAPDLL